MAGPTPTKVTIRSYLVGFGDCFLVSFHYREGLTPPIRRVLIDFGSSRAPKSGRTLKETAEHIAADITREGGRLDAVVATHRHADHIAGFAGAAGDIIASLAPSVIVQPWTEDPNAAPDATQPTPRDSLATGARSMVSYLAALDDMHTITEYAITELDRIAARRDTKVLTETARKQLTYLGDVNIKNKRAVETLIKMGRAGKAAYAFHGSNAGLSTVLPGVKVHVLGPPTLDQTNTIRRQRATDPDEYWHFQTASARQLATTDRTTSPIFPKAEIVDPRQLPVETRWLLPRLRELRGEQLLQIVRALDNALNNTSLILLFEAGTKKLLFPGDAQIENWRYCLEDAPTRQRNRHLQLLADTDVYKVGHHGSLNATPKTLWRLFNKKGDSNRPDRMHTIMSTLTGTHGHANRGTEVPRTTLTTALQTETHHDTTENLNKTNHYHDLTIDIT
jgi:hypothetical protein